MASTDVRRPTRRGTPTEPSSSHKRIVPRSPDHFGFAYLKGGRSERQCGQSTAAMRTGSAQNGQSLMPLAGITIPTVCLGRIYQNRPLKRRVTRSSDDPALAPWNRCLALAADVVVDLDARVSAARSLSRNWVPTSIRGPAYHAKAELHFAPGTVAVAFQFMPALSQAA